MKRQLTIYIITFLITVALSLPLFLQAKGLAEWLGIAREKGKAPDFQEMQLTGGSFLVAKSIPVLTKDIYPRLSRYCPYNKGEDYCVLTVTAYSSTPDQTDSTPFITAAGTSVRDGVVACNFLPFGTKLQFPELYGDKVFVVEDRLAWKNNHKIDIWFPSRWQALSFGVRRTPVRILD